MRTHARSYFTAALYLWSLMAVASDSEFRANEMAAQANVNTEAGAAYDYALGTAMQANPKFESGMTACLAKHPGEQSVHGYFHFTSATQYQVVLEPGSAFSACLANALEGFTVPEPPSVPYFNSFAFSTAP